jgi:hypothetical protein
MSSVGLLLVLAPFAALCIGVGLARRGHSAFGVPLAAAGAIAAIGLAAVGTWRPLLAVIAISGFVFGLEVDRPGDAKRRALGLLGIAVGLFALLIAGVYA